VKIKAAVVRQRAALFQIEDVELDDPREDEVLVRIAGCGLCHTDLAARDQLTPAPLPIVLGHEGSGVVEKVGARVRKVEPGDHVVLSFLSCGACAYCRKGMPSLCVIGFPLNFFGVRADGSHTIRKNGEAVNASFFGQSSFASYALANQQSVVKVPKEVPVEILGPLGCGVQTGAGGVINSLQARPGSSIAVFGAGSVGMSAVMAAAVCGCTKIVAVDIKEERLKIAQEFGATHVINSSLVDPVQEIQKLMGGGVDYSLDCTGVPAAIRQAVDALAVRGKCGIIGAPAPGTEMTLDVVNMLLGRSVVGIMGGDAIPDVFIPQLIDLYRQGRFPFDKMIRFYALDQINKAAEDSESGKTVKAVLRP
jgi:aryl-alcohol dehydrogenase